MTTTPGEFQIGDRLRRELYDMVRKHWERVRAGEGPGFVRRYPLHTSSGGGAYGVSGSVGTNYAKVQMGYLAVDSTTDVTLDSYGLLFANPGTYMVSGVLTVADTYSGESSVEGLWLAIYRDTDEIVAVQSHVRKAGSGGAGYEAVITDYPVAVEAGDHIYLYAKTESLTVPALSAVLGVHAMSGGSGGSTVTAIDGGSA